MKALLLLIVSGVFAAGVFILGKQARLEQLSPMLILFWQITGGALVVWLVSWPSRQFPEWSITHIRYYLLGGFLGISLPFALAFIVMHKLQLGLVGLVTALSPLATYALARMLGLEQGHPFRVLGLLAGLAGVVLLLIPDTSSEFSINVYWMLIALVIPLSLAASNIYRSRYWPEGSAAMPLAVGMLTVQSIGLLIMNLLLGNFQSDMLSSLQNSELLFVLSLVAGASYLSSFNLLRVGGPVYLSQMGYVITVVTLLAGITLWNERYDVIDLFSIGLIFSGVVLTTLTQSGSLLNNTITAPARRSL